MRKGKSLIGLRAISEMDGTDLGYVKDLIFDHDANQVLALLMSERDLFGLIDAQIIPWDQVSSIGPDAITVISRDSRVKAGSDHRVHSIMHRDTALSGTRVFTTDGRDLGTLADTLIDEKSGRIQGYEISGGFVSDTVSGKKFLPAEYELSVGRDVALVPPLAAEKLQSQGGLKGAAQEVQSAAQQTSEDVSQSIFHVYDGAREKVGATYESIAGASIEKQKAWVIGKTAARDVVIPSAVVNGASTPLATEAPVSGLSSKEIETPGSADVAADMTSSGEVVSGEVLVRQGEIITAAHAERAAQAGVLSSLLAAAIGGAANDAYAAGREKVSGAVTSGSTPVGGSTANLQEQLHAKAEAAALGKPSARDVLAEDGSVIVVAGQLITPDVLERARNSNRENEVLASAGLGAISQSAQTASAQVAEAASGLWEAARSKVNEWTQAAHERKAEVDAHAERERIKQAVGRPVTRVVLDQSDAVILNTGDIITHAAIERARQSGVLDILLDSVLVTSPEISPDMMRADVQGEAALSNTSPSGMQSSSAATPPDVAPSVAPVSVDPDGTKTYLLGETPEEAAGQNTEVTETSAPTSLIADESRSNDTALEAAMPPRGRSLPR